MTSSWSFVLQLFKRGVTRFQRCSRECIRQMVDCLSESLSMSEMKSGKVHNISLLPFPSKIIAVITEGVWYCCTSVFWLCDTLNNAYVYQRTTENHSSYWWLVLVTVSCDCYTGLTPWRNELKSSSLRLLSLPLTCLRLVCVPGSKVITRNRVQTCDSNRIASLNSRVYLHWNRERNIWIHEGLTFRTGKYTDWFLTTV